MSKLTYIQKIGCGISFLCLLWLPVAWSENDIAVEDMITMEGKVKDISFEKIGKYGKDTVLYCTLDNGRKFYANNNTHSLTQTHFSDTLRNAKNVKLWTRKDITSYEYIIPYQLAVDGVIYFDFNKRHSILPDYFWYVMAALVMGIVFMLQPLIVKARNV
jgi:hypothetical protein